MFSEKSDRVRQQTSRMARGKSYAQIWTVANSNIKINACQLPTSKSTRGKFQHQNQRVANSNIKINACQMLQISTSLQRKLQRCKTPGDVNLVRSFALSVDPCAEGFWIATNAEIKEQRVYFLESLGFYCFVYMHWVLPWSRRTNLILHFARLVDSISASWMFNPCVKRSSSSCDITNRSIGPINRHQLGSQSLSGWQSLSHSSIKLRYCSSFLIAQINATIVSSLLHSWLFNTILLSYHHSQ